MSKHCSNLLFFHLGSDNLLLSLDDHDNNLNSKKFGNCDNLLLIFSVAMQSRFLALNMLKWAWVCASEICSYLNYHINNSRIGPVQDVWMKQEGIPKEKQSAQFPNRQHVLDICLLGVENNPFFFFPCL